MAEQRKTKRSTRFTVLWAVWMGGGGLATFLIVWLLAGSIGWALLGLVGSGIVLNAIAQAVIQPVRAVRGPGGHA